MKAALLILVLSSAFAYGQDDAGAAAMQAAQQAQSDAMQATQIAQQAAQQAMQDSQRAAQQAMQDSQSAVNSEPSIGLTSPPTFSVKAGAVKPGTMVRIKCPTHYAAIYYTTNGWTPTSASRRYTGPIPIEATMQLQAIAQAPNMLHSLIARAAYTLEAPTDPTQALVLSADGVLRAGTRLHLVTQEAADSKTKQVGDEIRILLNQDVKVGDTVLIPKGTPVNATITQADSAGHAGAPGDIAFEVHSLAVRGIQIPLRGGETMEGAAHYKSRYFLFIPVVGIIPALAARGDEAEIKPGMTFTAAVTADILLQR
ncbi:MAG: chitobiase/beta-hexosaminidase C-terminal domain-containing protein [Terracidiphilus sp.]|nr:chitobiase/beta-hexosaminidase C-terminal domain-containing protein [Terracidiphilus sp.]MDR3776038.1 chitobiase/beta-hexosaminidase C-terminal domain-containing protein [Terracidiphilus sp.]